jgi:cation-transporting ATPase I
VHRPDRAEVAQALKSALERLEAVDWVEVNSLVGHVVVAFDPESTDLDRLLETVDAIEEATGVRGEDFAHGSGDHPANVESIVRNAVAVGVDVASLGLVAVERAAHLAPFMPELAAVIGMVDNHPRVRRTLAERFGAHTADVVGGSVSALSQGLAQGPAALVVDAVHRLTLISEQQGRRRAWRRREPELAGLPERVASAPLPEGTLATRPVPLPFGPVEREAEQSAFASVAGLGLGWLATGDRRRATALLAAGVPKAGRLGREAFAAWFDRELAERGTVVMHAHSLRRLDRVDTVIIDDAVLHSGPAVIDLIATDPPDDTDAGLRIRRLLDPSRPENIVRREGCSLGPIRRLRAEPTEALRAESERVTHPRLLTLGLAQQGRIVATCVVHRQRDPYAEALAQGARQAGLELILAVHAPPKGAAPATAAAAHNPIDRAELPDQPELAELPDLPEDAELLGADATVRAGVPLASEVRRLQRDGRVVLLVSASNNAALAAADVGVGLLGWRRVPWAADVLCGPGLREAWPLVAGVRAARTASERGAAVGAWGSATAALVALAGPAERAGARANLLGNVATLGAMAVGATGAVQLRGAMPMPHDHTPWHELTTGETLDRIDSRPDGLRQDEVTDRAAESRSDRAEEQPIGLPRAVAEELTGPLAPLLGMGMAVSGAVGAFSDAMLIGAAAGVNAVLGAAQRRGAERAVQRLAAGVAAIANVRREGHEWTVPADQVVPGDVLVLNAGDLVPADSRVLFSDGLEVDESGLTGESLPVGKSSAPSFATAVADRTSMLYEGTSVASGSARAVVVAVGNRTEAGKAHGAGAEGGPRRAQGVAGRLERLTRLAMPASAVAGASMIVAGAVRHQPLSRTLTSAVGLAVAAVPEGLPLLTTLAELAGAKRLSTRGVLVRVPSTIETLGRVDVLCFDKTGTLTEGTLELLSVSDGVQQSSPHELNAGLRPILACGRRASPQPNGDGRFAHATDRAVVDAAVVAGVAADEAFPSWQPTAELPFDSWRGFHAARGTTSDGVLLCVKGAPEAVLPRCVSWAPNGARQPLDDSARARVDTLIERAARSGRRVVAVAQRFDPGLVRDTSARGPALLDEDVAGLDLLGLVMMGDQARPAAPDAVERLRAAGLRIVMITGDHPSTAEAVAAHLGILNGGRVLSGVELARIDDAALVRVLPDISVFARVTPADKVRIVRAAQLAGGTVAMTGDGANDAAAMRMADVGIAVGAHSTPAARRAADIIVGDGRLESLLDAVTEGRAVWSSARNALSILLGGNVGEVAFVLTGAVLSGSPPLGVRQLLLVNLLTDLLPAITTAIQTPRDVTPQRLAAGGPEPSLSEQLTVDIVRRGVATAGGATAAWLGARACSTVRGASSVGLVALVGGQLVQTAITGRHSPLVLATTVASGAVLVGIVQTPGVSGFFGCRPLLPHEWALALAGSGIAAAGSVALTPVVRRLLPG